MSTKQTFRFAAAVLQALPEIPDKTMQEWIDKPRLLQQALKHLKGDKQHFISEAVETSNIKGRELDIRSFFIRTRIIELSPGFLLKFVEYDLRGGTHSIPDQVLCRVSTVGDTSDAEILSELPMGQAFNAAQLLGVIAELVTNRETELQLETTHANLFFVQELGEEALKTVSVIRRSSYWHCTVDDAEHGRWAEGTQVYYPN